MVEFSHDYWHAMDKDNVERIDVSMKDVGISLGIGDPWTNIKTAVTAGAKHVELGFMGTGKGSISSPVGINPETISKAKREDIRAFSKLNQVNITTHASANAAGFAGFGENGFNDQAAEKNMHEAERAIEFAADVSDGGSVTIHTGEFPSVLSTARGEKFELYPGEAKKGMVGLVNKKSGQIVGNFHKDIEIPDVKTVDGKPFVLGKSEPLIDPETGLFKYKAKGLTYADFLDMHKKGEINEDPSLAFFKAFRKKELEQTKAEEGKWMDMYKSHQETYEDIDKMKKSIIEIQKSDKENGDRIARDYIRSKFGEQSHEGRKAADFQNNPIKLIEETQTKIEREMKHTRDGAIGYGKKAFEIEEDMKNITSVEDFAVKKSATNIARLGIKAFETEKRKGLSKPLFISPENVFAEQYGAHPQELKRIITASRDEMVKLLTQPKTKEGNANPYYKKDISVKEAEKIAQDHVKANFDIGHANTWRKYFKGTNEEFDKWVMGEVDDLIKNKIIGHAHVSDNFGYEDEHLSVGEGNAPISGFIKKLKDAGMSDEIIFEPGGQGEGESIYNALFTGWERAAHSPVYRMAGQPMTWTDVSGYFNGRTFTPSYMSGAYLVNPQAEENWWSGTPIE